LPLVFLAAAPAVIVTEPPAAAPAVSVEATAGLAVIASACPATVAPVVAAGVIVARVVVTPDTSDSESGDPWHLLVESARRMRLSASAVPSAQEVRPVTPPPPPPTAFQYGPRALSVSQMQG
jgi:hypothetical protein